MPHSGDGLSIVYCPSCDADVPWINGEKICPHGKPPRDQEEYELLMQGVDCCPDPRER